MERSQRQGSNSKNMAAVSTYKGINLFNVHIHAGNSLNKVPALSWLSLLCMPGQKPLAVFVKLSARGFFCLSTFLFEQSPHQVFHFDTP